MLRKLYCTGLLSFVVSSIGCALCCSPDDCNYGTYGGRWQRYDMANGRVSSIFAEAGYDSLGKEAAPEPAAEPELIPGDDQIQPISYDDVSSYIE
ncbi:MAG: hypothetical protein H6822_36595 [Planctomycetaceae bacterium]|nr:hypothetical protein [Planctomycetales bacterium]MCB9927708.1 hypothetical protein [Planctomycetaceae bacterium]